jgi:hypothetical protein
MSELIATIISGLLIAAYVVALLSVLSTLLFLVGLWRFIRYERRVARNWNRLRSYSRSRPGPQRPDPRRPRSTSAVVRRAASQ